MKYEVEEHWGPKNPNSFAIYTLGNLFLIKKNLGISNTTHQNTRKVSIFSSTCGIRRTSFSFKNKPGHESSTVGQFQGKEDGIVVTTIVDVFM